MTRTVRREISRRYVDSTQIDVRCMHGVVYLRGRLEKLRSHPDVDLDEEAEVINKILRQKPGVREVVWEVEKSRQSLRTRVQGGSSGH